MTNRSSGILGKISVPPILMTGGVKCRSRGLGSGTENPQANGGAGARTWLRTMERTARRVAPTGEVKQTGGQVDYL